MTLVLDARRLQRVAAAALAALAAVSAAVACASDGEADPQAPDGGTSSGGLDEAFCPGEAPPAGSGCALPEGTTCNFGRCSTLLGRCTKGIWSFAANEPPRPPCPAANPDIDEACPPCWPSGVTCTYGSQDCSAADASANTAVAACVDGRWSVEVRPCRDAGPDVQGDGGGDAD